jgi:hypothetical protein
MPFVKRTIDFITMGSERPVRRLVAYYLLVAAVVSILLYLFPIINLAFSGERLSELTSSRVLEDSLATSPGSLGLPPRLEFVVSATLSLIGTLVLMLPVSWVYMSVQRDRIPSSTIVETLIILPIAVAGVVLVVRNSLALAFSLAGVLAGVRFRTRITDARDLVFIFVAIGVGFAAGVQVMTVAALLSVFINFVLLFSWRYGWGKNMLIPSASTTQWVEPLQKLADQATDGAEKVPDRALALALPPEQVQALEERFDRIRAISGGEGSKKARFNAILSITTNEISPAQRRVQPTLDKIVKRWALDEVVTHNGTPSELYYLIRIKKATTKDEVLTAVRQAAGETIESAEIELGAELTTSAKKDA